jgi:hypothetical protein
VFQTGSVQRNAFQLGGTSRVSAAFQQGAFQGGAFQLYSGGASGTTPSSAFQQDAFQQGAFQMYGGTYVAPTTTPGGPGGWGISSDVQYIDDTRWRGERKAREEAREAVNDLFKEAKVARPKQRKEAVQEVARAVQQTARRITEAPSFIGPSTDYEPLLSSLSNLESLLAQMALQDQIRQAEIEQARLRWVEIEQRLVYEAFLEEELMIVLALTLDG